MILLSGGGSGPEPAHTGYVGEGMLDVGVTRNIFASPSASQIFAGVKSVDAPQGYDYIDTLNLLRYAESVLIQDSRDRQELYRRQIEFWISGYQGQSFGIGCRGCYGRR